MAAAVIVCLAVLGYANSFRVPFVFDDIPEIRDNRLLGDLAANLPGGSAARVYPNRWVVYLTFALNRAAGGLDPAGYHLVNLAVHVAAALLVLALVLRAFKTPVLSRSRLAPRAGAVAFIGAVLFATHPLQTQAVTYVVQRTASLATLFYLAAVVLYVRWRTTATDARSSRAIQYAALLGSAYLAVRTKEIAFTLPAVLVLCEAVFFGGAGWRRWIPILPVLAIALLIPWTLMPGASSPGAVAGAIAAAARTRSEVTRWDYLLTEIPVVATYLRLLVLPIGQSFDHDRSILHSLLAPEVLASLAVLLGLAATAIFLWRRTGHATHPLDPAARLIAFGILWFFVTASVESSVIPILDPIVEHRAYLPSVGFFVALASAGALLASRGGATRPVVSLALVAMAIALVLAGATFARNRVWADPLTLWADAAEKAPQLTRPHSNIGLILADRGRVAEAVEHFRTVVALRPDHLLGYNNLAVALMQLGRFDEAARVLETALRRGPDFPETWFNVGKLALATERDAEAETAFKRAISLQPRYPAAYSNLGAVLNRQQRYAESAALLEGARDQLGDSAEAHFNLGVAHAAMGDLPAARREADLVRRLSASLASQLDAFVQARASDFQGGR